jgi:myo-inositol-1(or 4)-monophosphatase
MQDFQATRDKAVAIARRAGEIVREGWGNAGEIGYKGEVDLVTEHDEQAEKEIVRALQQAFPDHAIHAEEEGIIENDNAAESPFTWVIDPIDGTTNFAHAFPVFAVSLALLRDNRPVVGVIYDPLRDECFAAIRDQGAELNGSRIHVSGTQELDTALLATGFPYDRRTRPDNNVGHLSHFIRRCQGLRRAGSASLDLSYVACGRLDGFWEKLLHPWDVAAGVLVVEEAGGRLSDFSGGADYLSGEEIVASNGLIHTEMLDVLQLGDVLE